MTELNILDDKMGPGVLCIVTEATGEVPGKVGFKMLVKADGSILGTVGGGGVEKAVIEQAQSFLQQKSAAQCIDFDLGSDDHRGAQVTGMICGGRVRVYFECFGVAQRVLMFGAGHISQELAPLLLKLGYRVEVYDDRAEFANSARFGEQVVLHVGNYSDLVNQAQLASLPAVIILTHGHSHDELVLDHLVDRWQQGEQLSYLGMIGSAKKVTSILRRLQDKGRSAELLQKVYTPIGLELGGNSPFAIALSICAELEAVFHKVNAQHMRYRRLTSTTPASVGAP